MLNNRFTPLAVFTCAAAGWLLMGGATAEAASFYKLFTAIAESRMAQVKELTPPPGMINRVDNASGATPLTWASMAGVKPEVAVWLIAHGAKVNLKDGDGETPLTTAADYGNAAAARVLLKSGADPKRTNDLGETPLFLSCGLNGNLQTVRALVSGGVKPTGRDKAQALEYAIFCGRDQTVRFLRGLGARPSYFKTLARLFSKKKGEVYKNNDNPFKKKK